MNRWSKQLLTAARLRLRPDPDDLFRLHSWLRAFGYRNRALGAGARVSMGNAVVGGMTFATLVGIFMIPVLFVVVERLFNRKKHSEE